MKALLKAWSIILLLLIPIVSKAGCPEVLAGREGAIAEMARLIVKSAKVEDAALRSVLRENIRQKRKQFELSYGGEPRAEEMNEMIARMELRESDEARAQSVSGVQSRQREDDNMWTFGPRVVERFDFPEWPRLDVEPDKLLVKAHEDFHVIDRATGQRSVVEGVRQSATYFRAAKEDGILDIKETGAGAVVRLFDPRTGALRVEQEISQPLGYRARLKKLFFHDANGIYGKLQTAKLFPYEAPDGQIAAVVVITDTIESTIFKLEPFSGPPKKIGKMSAYAVFHQTSDKSAVYAVDFEARTSLSLSKKKGDIVISNVLTGTTLLRRTVSDPSAYDVPEYFTAFVEIYQDRQGRLFAAENYPAADEIWMRELGTGAERRVKNWARRPGGHFVEADDGNVYFVAGLVFKRIQALNFQSGDSQKIEAAGDSNMQPSGLVNIAHFGPFAVYFGITAAKAELRTLVMYSLNSGPTLTIPLKVGRLGILDIKVEPDGRVIAAFYRPDEKDIVFVQLYGPKGPETLGPL